MQNAYELMVLVQANQSDSAIAKKITAIKKQLTDAGADITFEDDWGKRTMTYDIKGQDEAYYYVWQFLIEGEKVNPLDNEMNLDHEILRRMFTRLPDNYQSKDGQHVIEIVSDIINFGDRSKSASSQPMGNPNNRGKKRTPASDKNDTKSDDKSDKEDAKKLDKKVDEIINS